MPGPGSDNRTEGEACPGQLDWTVTVPECDKEYTIELQQERCESLESPKFTVACAADESWEDSGDDASKTWEDSGSVTVVYYDEDCTCTKSKTTAAPTHTNPVWYDDDLSCSVTVESAAATGWADAPADASKTWGDAPAPTGTGQWADATDAGHSWSDASVDASSAGWADNSAAPVADAHTWADNSVAPASATGSGWADAAPASTAAAGSSWADSPVAPLESKPAVADYKGAATQLGASFGALAAVFLAALAL